MTRRGATGLVLVLLVSLAACTSADRSSIQGQPVALPTPMASLSAAVARTAELLRGALADAGFRLEQPLAPYRASEPPSLLEVGRAVFRVALAAPGEGHIVVYQLTDAAQAGERARELAAYLGSGFGQTNFAPDAQFWVAVEDDTVIFTSWSRARAADPVAAEAAFEAVWAVGEPVEVLK